MRSCIVASSSQAPLDPDLERLQREPAAAGQLEIGVGQLVHRPRPGRRRDHEQPRARARDAQLVAEQEPCRRCDRRRGMVAAERHLAVGLADDEGVAGFQDDAMGEVNRRRAHAPRSGGTAAAAATPPAAGEATAAPARALVDAFVARDDRRHVEALAHRRAAAAAVDLVRAGRRRAPSPPRPRRRSRSRRRSTTSGAEPSGKAITGVPQAIASTITMPNGSGPPDRHQQRPGARCTARACPRSPTSPT